MRARAARIMAEIRSDHGLTVGEAWHVYRRFRDNMTEKPSLASLGRHKRQVNEFVEGVREPPPEEFPEDFGEYDWEVTVEYEG